MPLKNNTVMPSLAGATVWYNGEPAVADLTGKPLLVHFWSVSCGICGEQMHELNRWRETYGPRGLKMIAVHKPRSEQDTELPRVEAAVVSHGLTHPVAVDNTHAMVGAFHNEGVPEFFLFDADGRLRLNVVGDAGFANLEKMIVLLLRAAQLQSQPQTGG